ncbi:hypothetical protein GR183_06170 [Stappia sp. GBMRC 2046]|uniref:Uncharacterized protein n=1 Tax=Stappia sediminis TaxID=2692190 RepID=A0A7X3S791_9HYPH|nr:hypothetical protein [Stappia sediminis]MXN64484.1 hypothetical protein [Stappia sediminis]
MQGRAAFRAQAFPARESESEEDYRRRAGAQANTHDKQFAPVRYMVEGTVQATGGAIDVFKLNEDLGEFSSTAIIFVSVPVRAGLGQSGAGSRQEVPFQMLDRPESCLERK